jgi:hypothetical protein
LLSIAAVVDDTFSFEDALSFGAPEQDAMATPRRAAESK